MSRPPEQKSFTDKLKQYFRGNKTAGVTRSRSFEQSIFLTDDLIAELQKESSPATRIKAIKEFTETIRDRKLENFTIEKLWTLLSDLLQPQTPRESRHLVLGLFTLICQQQSEKNGLIRVKFFSFIQSHEVPEDTFQRFEFLKALTENGRDITYFDDRIGGFLVQWTSNRATSLTNVNAFMSFAGNVIKFNQSFIDSEVLSKIVENVCVIGSSCKAKEDVLECLNVLSFVISYSSLPPGCLPTFLATLCRFVNVESLDQISWKIMRDLLGTHFGHSGLLTMCQFMESVTEDVAVVRGSIFFAGAALWGNRMVRSLNYQPTTVLSSFIQALDRNHLYVTYEVISRVQDLVKNRGDTLQLLAWDLILDIVMKVTESTKTSEGKTYDDSSSHSRKIVKAVSETLDCIEAIVDAPSFCGSQEKFFAVLESCCSLRHENSVGKLLQYKVTQLLHSSRPYWFANLVNFTEKYYRQETRAAVKIKALNQITSVCLSNRDTHEEDLIDKVILPHLKSLETEADVKVRQLGTQFIVDFVLVSSSRKCHDLLHILERVVTRPFDFAPGDRDIVHIFTENEVVDVYTAVQGLVKIFQKKIYYLPSSIAVQAYKIVVKHLESHYKKTSLLDHCQHIRYIIFDCFFKIRANSMYHLGFPDTPTGRVSAYSPYIAVNYSDELENEHTAGISNSPGAQSSSSPQQSGSGGGSSNPHVTFVSFSLACKLVVGSLRKEKDWKVLELILKQIPYVLENKALILSKHGNDIDHLATALCAMMMDKSVGFPESLRNTPQTFLRSDFQCFLYPILTALVSYHSHLESAVQVKIVKCLEMGLVSKSSRVCILSLSTCSLEMKDTMHKLLPEVLLALSKISPKVNIAIPVLEFLSTLIHLPRVFASFVQDQYMSIFAITFPYTNPFKFNHYTVSLAHHVIAMWFLKCRLSFRRGFVSYIIKGLEANVWAPFEEETRRNALEIQNEDSSSRGRSSSLNEQSKKPRERAISGHSNAQRQASGQGHGGAARDSKLQLTDIKPMNKASMTFHQELTETCVDLMARYAFADCSALPTRFHSTTFLLKNGYSQTWIMDNKIITITTSGCTQKELRDGLCDKCWLLCRKPSPVLSNASEEEGDEGMARSNSRRRHRSEYTGQPTSEGQKLERGQGADSKTKDDLHLENKLQNAKKVNGVPDHTDGFGGLGFGDWSSKSKNEHMLCTCWCQGWAEIHVRRPTGNTSWMMRIQNRVGNFSGSDILFRELSDVFLSQSAHGRTDAPSNNINTSIGHTPPLSSTASSANASPSRQKSSGIGASEKENSSSFQESPGFPTSPNSSRNSPSEPNSPTEIRSPGSPETSPSGRIYVRRSNSSPEMDSWRNPFTQQNQIQEDDEEECLSIDMTKTVAKVETQNTNSKGDDPKERDKREKERNATVAPGKGSSTSKSGSGITSPYRTSYEAIPEEVSSSLAKETGAHSGPNKPPSPTKSEKYLRTQQSLDENKTRAMLMQEKTNEKSGDENMLPIKRDRGFTISGLNPAARTKVMQRMLAAGGTSSEPYKFLSRDYDNSAAVASGSETSIRSGINPSFVFLQLCSQGFFGGSKPLLLPASMENTVKVLDYIPPYETHKIGVLYVGSGQVSNETAILQNKYGSARYRDFLQGLGSLIKLSEVDHQKTFLGGLSKDGADGEYAYIWQDDVMQVMFHVATLMPNKPTDPSGNDKKRHIGNDYVAIIYNNSDEDFDISTMKGQFLYACVVVQPLDHRTNRLIVKFKHILAEHIGPAEPKIVSDQNLPIMARQLALHLNLASLIYQSMQKKDVDPYASNWLERLRKIKKLRTRLMEELASANNSGINDSGSDYNNSGAAAIANSSNSNTLSSSQSYKRNFHVDDFTEFV